MRLTWKTDNNTPHLRCYYSTSRVDWFICIRTHSVDVWREHNFYPLVRHLNNDNKPIKFTVYYANIHLSGLMI